MLVAKLQSFQHPHLVTEEITFLFISEGSDEDFDSTQDLSARKYMVNVRRKLMVLALPFFWQEN